MDYAGHNLVAHRHDVVAHRDELANPNLVANHRDALVSAPAAKSFIPCQHLRLECATNFYSPTGVACRVIPVSPRTNFVFPAELSISSWANTVVQRRDISSTVFKIYASVVPSAATRRYK
jgi:hypothetical protein